MPLTREEVRQLVEQAAERAAEKAADETVRNLFARIGVNIETTEHAHEVQKDFLFLRAFRETCQAVRRRAIATLVTLGVTSVAVALGWKASGR